jgi:hypothetical protein
VGEGAVPTRAELLTALDDSADELVSRVRDFPAGAWDQAPEGIESGSDGLLQVRPGAAAGAAASITGSALDFPIWGTRRRPWGDYDLAIDGDAELAARFLDALNLV